MAAEWLALSQQGRGQLRRREGRKLRWGIHDGLFYNVVLAADYISVQGDVSVQDSSLDGLPYVAYLDAGDVLTYNAVLQSTGKYRMELRVASPFGEGGIQLRNSQNVTQIYASIDTLPASGDWNLWQTVETTVDLLENEFNLDLVVVETGYNLLWLSLELLEEIDNTAEPSEPPVAVPTIEPHPATSSQINGICMVSLGADEYTGADEEARLSSENNTLELGTSSWAVYSVQVPADGKYLWQMTMTLSSASGTLNLTNAETKVLYASIRESAIDSWRDINVVLVLEAGMHNVKIDIMEGSWTLSSVCLDGIEFVNVHYIESIDINTAAPMISIETVPTAAPMVSLNESTATMAPTSPAKAAPTSTPVVTYSQSNNTGNMTSTRPTEGAPTATPTTESTYTGTLPPTNPIEGPPTMAPVVVTMTLSNTSTMAPTSSLQLSPTAPPIEAPTQATNSSQTEAPVASPKEIILLLTANETSSMYGAVLEETSSENTPCITQLDAYDWVRYPMSTLVGGNYTMEIRVSSASGECSFELIDYGTGITYASMESIPATGDDNWETVSSRLTLPEGDVHLMIRVREGGWMYSWISFSEALI
jgi:hypothetical protein